MSCLHEYPSQMIIKDIEFRIKLYNESEMWNVVTGTCIQVLCVTVNEIKTRTQRRPIEAHFDKSCEMRLFFENSEILLRWKILENFWNFVWMKILRIFWENRSQVFANICKFGTFKELLREFQKIWVNCWRSLWDIDVLLTGDVNFNLCL